jgi:hypothetical protein
VIEVSPEVLSPRVAAPAAVRLSDPPVSVKVVSVSAAVAEVAGRSAMADAVMARTPRVRSVLMLRSSFLLVVVLGLSVSRSIPVGSTSLALDL